MRIERLETVPYALPFRAPYVTARGRLERRELLLLRIWTDSGFAGLGEAVSLSLRGGPTVAEIARDLHERSAPLLEGAELCATGWEALAGSCHSPGISPQARAAVELALLDLSGKLAGQPAWRMLGATSAAPVRCNATLPAANPSDAAKQALSWAARGFRTFKLKVGLNGDVEQVRAVRGVLGAGAAIRIDANAAWEAERAIAVLLELEKLEIELVEQPAPSLRGLVEVRRRSTVPVAADESIASAEDARRASAMGACDAATVKIAKMGGIAEARAVIATLPVYLSSALDGPVGIAGAAHLAQTLPHSGFAAGLAHGLATAELFDATIASRACELKDGALTPPDGPGLGVEIDETALRRQRI